MVVIGGKGLSVQQDRATRKTAAKKPSSSAAPNIPTSWAELSAMLVKIRNAALPITDRFSIKVGSPSAKDQDAQVAQEPAQRRTVSHSSAEKQAMLSQKAQQAVSGGIKLLVPEKFILRILASTDLTKTPKTQDIRNLSRKTVAEQELVGAPA